MVLKKLERKISWDLYIAAFIISLIIFTIGVFVGLQIEKTVYDEMNERMNNIANKILLISNLMLLEDEKEYCSYFKSEIKKFDEETYELGKQIEFMEEKRGVDEKIKINYMELEFRDYLLSKKINNMCGGNQNLILYFVDSEKCEICKKQGEIITSARIKTDTKVYTFDLAIDTSLIKMLKEKYQLNDKNTPIIVINEKVYEGVMSEEEILAKLK